VKVAYWKNNADVGMSHYSCFVECVYIPI